MDNFELRVLAEPSPIVDVSTLQAAVDSLRPDIDTILKARVPEFVDPTEDIVLVALFATSEIPPPPPREHAKRRRGRAEEMRKLGRRSAERWRLRGEPHLLRGGAPDESIRVSGWGV